MLTVACVKTRGGGRRGYYDGQYVANLQAMVREHLPEDPAFACITDDPTDLPGDVRPIPAKAPEWWAKLQLFDIDSGLLGRVLYIDLDSLVVGDLSEIVAFDAEFAVTPNSARNWRSKNRKVYGAISSAVMAFDAGCAPELWYEFDETVSERLYGDQDWIHEKRPDLPVMPKEWFDRLTLVARRDGEIRPETRIIHCVKPKNHLAARQWPWVARLWNPRSCKSATTPQGSGSPGAARRKRSRSFTRTMKTRRPFARN